MRLLRAAEHRRMAWKNGGGETVEIAVGPAGAELDGFDWRVSMARVAVDGPFSCFPGIDRTLMILGGAGVDLDVEGHGRHRLTAGTAAFSFLAEAPTMARLIDGPVTDLNVMTRRGRWRHEVLRLSSGVRTLTAPPNGLLLVLCGDGTAECRSEAGRHRLRPGDALVVERASAATVEADAGGHHYAIVLDPDPRLSQCPPAV